MTSVSTHPLTAEALLAVSPVVPVVVIDDVDQAVPLARALARGGVGIIEITLRTAAGIGAIERVAAEVPEIVTGAGTVTTPEDAEAVRRAGAQFIVTPGSPPRLLQAVLDTGIPLLAGSSTLTEMMRLAEHGLSAMKFFPAEASGGRDYLSAVAGPHAGPALLPDRWHLDGQRRGLPRAAQRRLRGRVLAHAEGRRGRGGLGPHRAAGPRGGGAARLTAGGHGTARELPAGAGVRWTSRTGSRAAVDCSGLRFTLAVRAGAPEGGQWNRLASAQPPHTSVGYSLGGPPPFLCTPDRMSR